MTKLRRWLLPINLLSIAFLYYVLQRVSPFTVYPQLNILAVILFAFSLFLVASSAFALICQRLHERWPKLSGARGIAPKPIAAIRQGLLFGLAFVLLVLLAITQVLDVMLVLAVVVLLGLLEGFFQSRQ